MNEIKKLTAEQYETRYQSYLSQVRKWGEKGYVVSEMTRSEFRSEYDYERTKSAAIGDVKRSIIRELANESRELNYQQMRSFIHEVSGDSMTIKEFRERYENLTRQEVFDWGMYYGRGQYDAARAFYNAVFG